MTKRSANDDRSYLSPDRSVLRRYLRRPQRFRHSAHIGAYVGLTPRRYQSGEIDRTGRIPSGNHQARTYLFEATNVLLTVVRRGSALERCCSKLAKRIGAPNKARLPSLAKWLSSTMPYGLPHEPALNEPRPAFGGTCVPAGTEGCWQSRSLPCGRYAPRFEMPHLLNANMRRSCIETTAERTMNPQWIIFVDRG
ncbi:transposase [Bradyrhizobium sp. UFLA05-109]